MVYFEPAYWLGICIYMIVMSRGQTQLLHSESSERQLKILDYFCIHTTQSPSYHVILFQHQLITSAASDICQGIFILLNSVGLASVLHLSTDQLLMCPFHISNRQFGHHWYTIRDRIRVRNDGYT